MEKRRKFKTVKGDRYIGMKYHSTRTTDSGAVYTCFTPAIGREKVDVWVKDRSYNVGGVYELL